MPRTAVRRVGGYEPSLQLDEILRTAFVVAKPPTKNKSKRQILANESGDHADLHVQAFGSVCESVVTHRTVFTHICRLIHRPRVEELAQIRPVQSRAD